MGIILSTVMDRNYLTLKPGTYTHCTHSSFKLSQNACNAANIQTFSNSFPTIFCLFNSVYYPLQSTLSVRLKMTVIPHRLNIMHRDPVLRLLCSMCIDTLLLLPIPAVVFRGIVDTLVRSSRDKLLLITSTTSAVIFVVIRSTAADSKHPEDTRCNAKCHCQPSCS